MFPVASFRIAVSCYFASLKVNKKKTKAKKAVDQAFVSFTFMMFSRVMVYPITVLYIKRTVHPDL